MNTFFGYKILMVAIAGIPLVMLATCLVISLNGGANPANEHYGAGLLLHQQGRL